MERALFTEKDFFLGGYSRGIFASDRRFDIYNNRVVFPVRGGRRGGLNELKFAQVSSVEISRSLFGKTYNVTLVLLRGNAISGNIFSPSRVLFVTGLSQENASRLRQVLLDIKNEKLPNIPGHSAEETLLGQNVQRVKQIDGLMKGSLLLALKISLIVGIGAVLLFAFLVLKK